jgi:hypothetical protein
MVTVVVTVTVVSGGDVSVEEGGKMSWAVI